MGRSLITGVEGLRKRMEMSKGRVILIALVVLLIVVLLWPTADPYAASNFTAP
jgi:hypothetical protein